MHRLDAPEMPPEMTVRQSQTDSGEYTLVNTEARSAPHDDQRGPTPGVVTPGDLGHPRTDPWSSHLAL